MVNISFGDLVKIKKTSVTNGFGYVGLEGEVLGHTIPSSSGVTGVVGDNSIDYAVSVFFKERNETVWFDENLLEFVKHGSGQEIRIDGSPVKLVRDELGEWHEESA
jgi:RNase P/RNase MRP subunit p29